MQAIVTYFSDDAPTREETFEGNVGACLMLIFAVNKHIDTGGWVMIDAGNRAHFIDKPIDVKVLV